MSIKTTRHPKTGEWKEAEWLDNFFGKHRYGVKFGPREIYDANKYNWETK